MRAIVILLFVPTLWAQLSREERWQADLDVLMNTLQSRHPNLYTKAPREQWDEAVAALRSRVAALSDTQVAMEVARIAALAGDGHTFVNLRTSPIFTSLPLRLQWFEEGWVATTVPVDQPAMLGTVVNRLDGTPVAEVIEKIRPYVSYENEWWFRVQVLNYLISPEILANLGVQGSRNAIMINDEWLVPAAAPGIAAGPILAQPRFPLWTRYNGLNYWFHYLAESRTIYVKYNVCAEMPVLPAARFRAELAAALADNAVERIILDVRTNTGGNSAVLARLLPVVPAGVKRVVITGRQTFSSGLWAASDLSRAGWTLVGEPTGGKPSAFGEVVGFTLPHSGLRGQTSTRFFRGTVQPDGESLRPDVLVPWTWAGFSQELDGFLDAALAVN
jgi:hypothetical protein